MSVGKSGVGRPPATPGLTGPLFLWRVQGSVVAQVVGGRVRIDEVPSPVRDSTKQRPVLRDSTHDPSVNRLGRRGEAGGGTEAGPDRYQWRVGARTSAEERPKGQK